MFLLYLACYSINASLLCSSPFFFLLCFRSDSRSISPHQHSFLPRRSCSSNLLVSEEVVTPMMDRQLMLSTFILPRPLTPSTTDFFWWEAWSLCVGLKHPFLVVCREFTSVQNSQQPFLWGWCHNGDSADTTRTFTVVLLLHGTYRLIPPSAIISQLSEKVPWDDSRWFWHSHSCIKISQGSMVSDR